MTKLFTGLTVLPLLFSGQPAPLKVNRWTSVNLHFPGKLRSQVVRIFGNATSASNFILQPNCFLSLLLVHPLQIPAARPPTNLHLYTPSSDGLQLNSDGLHPSSDGLHPK